VFEVRVFGRADSFGSHAQSTGATGSVDEERAAFSTVPKVSMDEDSSEARLLARHKWVSVKRRMLGGGTKLVKLKALPERSLSGPWKGGPIACFARSASSVDREDAGHHAAFELSFFELMVRERPELALRMLDSQRRLLYQRQGSRTYSYRLKLVGTPLRSTAALQQMVLRGHSELVSHPVCQWLINVKFFVVTRYFLYFDFFMAVVFAALLWLTFDAAPGHVARWGAALVSLGGLLSAQGASAAAAWQAVQALLWLLTVVVALRTLLRHALRTLQRHVVQRRGVVDFQLVSAALGMRDKLATLPALYFVAREVLLWWPPAEQDAVHPHAPQPQHPQGLAVEAARVCSAVALLLTVLHALKLSTGLFAGFGLTVQTIVFMFQDCRDYFFALFVFVGAFAVALSMLYSGSGVKEFGTLPDAFTTLFFFVFNLDWTVVQQDPVAVRRTVATLALALYEVLCALTLVNLIIAVYTTSYERTSALAREQCLLTRARFVLDYEEQVGLMAMLFSRYSKGCKGWFSWEKANVMERSIYAKEFPDGKVLIEVRVAWLRFLRAKALPPTMKNYVWLYDLFSPCLPLAEFSWDSAEPPQGWAKYSESHCEIAAVAAGLGLARAVASCDAADSAEAAPLDTRREASQYGALAGPQNQHAHDTAEPTEVPGIIGQSTGSVDRRARAESTEEQQQLKAAPGRSPEGDWAGGASGMVHVGYFMRERDERDGRAERDERDERRAHPDAEAARTEGEDEPQRRQHSDSKRI
jgi:hypothetical protein